MHRPILSIIALVMLAGCNLIARPTPAREVNTDTPEGAALEYVSGQAPQAEAAQFSFSAIHTWSLGRDSLVAYSFAGGYDEQWERCNGQARVALEAGGWHVTEAGHRCWDDLAEAITGVYTFVPDAAGEMQTVVYGDLLVPDVSAVSIEFKVGGESEVAHMDRAGYWLMRPGQIAPVRAIAIDEAGYLIQMLAFDEVLAVSPVDP